MPARKRLLRAAAVGCLLVAFSSCDENPPPPLVPAPQGPILAFAPDTLFFRAPGDSFVSYLKVRKILEVWNGGTETLYWRASEDVPWLTFSATHEGSSKGERDTVQVFAWFDQIEEDQTLEADIVVSAGTESRTVRAVATNTMNGWVCASAVSLSFDWETARDPKTLQVRSCGGSRMPWTAAANVDWPQLTPRNGESTGEWDDVEVAVDWSRIGDTDAVSGEIEVAGPVDTAWVRVSAQPSPTLLCVDHTVFELDEGTDPGPVSLGIRNCGTGEMDWSVSTDKTWAVISPASGTSAGEWDSVRVSISWPEVPYSETETATLTVLAEGRQAEAAINAHPLPPPVPALCVDSTRVTLNEHSRPGPVVFRVRNCGYGLLDWSVSADEPWVLLSPAGGTSSGEWDSVSVSIDWPNTPRFRSDGWATVTVTAGGESARVWVFLQYFCRIRVVDPTTTTDWLAGEMHDLRWTGRGMDRWVHVDLYKGNQWVRSFGEEFPIVDPGALRVTNTGRFTWMVSGYGVGPGSDYRFRVSGGCIVYSEYFTIIEPPCFIAVTRPPNPWGWTTESITWDPSNAGPTVSIDLYKEDVFQHVIVSATENDGAYEWLADDYGGGSGRYRVKITDTADSTCTGMSDYFNL